MTVSEGMEVSGKQETDNTDMQKLFRRPAVAPGNTPIISNTKVGCDQEGTHVTEAEEGVLQRCDSSSSSCGLRHTQAPSTIGSSFSGHINPAFDDSSPSVLRRSSTIESPERVLHVGAVSDKEDEEKDDTLGELPAMKVRPLFSPRGGVPVVNAAVGEKLATSGRTAPTQNYLTGNILTRNGSKVYASEDGNNSSSSTSDIENATRTLMRPEVNDSMDNNNDGSRRCGWWSWRPDFIQFCNNPRGYLVFLCILALIQNMTVLGYLNVVITTLERRFRLTSVRSGFVVIAYDISNLIVCAFVTYFGERGRKPVWVGVGSIVFSVGSVIFALPHFLARSYQYGVTMEEVCPVVTNETSLDACADMTSSADESLQPYYWLFIAGQVLHGWGGSTLYTLGITYMDESLPSATFGLYMGIFTAMNAVGPALGYIIGGVFLSELYTDVMLPSSSLNITPDNPLWVGAWWLGFVINGAILFVSALLYLGFPKKLPVSDQVLEAKRVESQAGCEFESREGYLDSLRDFPRALRQLLTNAPFLCIGGMATSEWFVYAGLTSFGPKFFESQFNISAGDASNDIGIISVMAGIVGSIMSGIIMKRMDLSVKGLLKMSIGCALVSLGSQFVFLFHCPDVPFAGVTVPYDGSNGYINMANLSAACHASCACANTFDPVCGENNILYYSACHAGCTVKEENLFGDIMYSECACIPPELSYSTEPTTTTITSSNNVNATFTAAASLGGTVTRGRCSQTCGHRYIFYVMMFISFLSTSMLIVPAWTATIRCVAHSLRGFALGLQTVMYGALGTVPAPIIFGLLIDRSCLLWETECDGSKSCWLYNNKIFSHSFLIITVVLKFVTLLLSVGALFTYRPAPAEKEEPGIPMLCDPGEKHFRRTSSLRQSVKSGGLPYTLTT